MAEVPVIEDERGVDISQMRAMLRRSVPERIAEMVHAAPTDRRWRLATSTSFRHEHRTTSIGLLGR